MNIRKIITLALFTFVFGNLLGQNNSEYFRSSTGKWEIETLSNGIIKSLKMDFGSKSDDKSELTNIPWHCEGEYAGPVLMSSDLTHSISYKDEDGNLAIVVSLKNNTDNKRLINSDEASLRIGIDHIMNDPSKYFSIFFPTLLRCEKTHFWGYFQNPDGKVLVICSPNAIASWQIDYIGNGHRIATSNLDMLHQLPLPARHPQELFYLAPNEEKTWKILLLPLSSVSEVPEAIASACGIPAIDLQRTTASAGETVDFKIFSSSNTTPLVIVTDPLGNKIPVSFVKKQSRAYCFEIVMPKMTGTYEIKVESNGFQSQASIYNRKQWSWYLQQASNEAMRAQQKAAQHREAWMGFFSEYWAQVYFPDTEKLEETERKFNIFWQEMIDPQTGFYYTNKSTWSSRPQNTSWMLGVLVARYAATRDIKHLELAVQWADFLIDKFQLPTGAYKGYTALTMGAKFLQELLWFEVPLTEKNEQWKERYERHKCSIQAAAKNILTVKDLGDTEGESTYEDTQAGSAWSLLAMHALIEPNSPDFSDFLKEAIAVQSRHECLTQALIPDSRMRGGTLRWWEAQYDVLIKRNMMNSPHGWTMRSQFGALYLYLLTGKEYFLNVAFNAMSSCSQAIDHKTGTLRWTFIPDPYVEIERFVPNEQKSGEGKYAGDIIGEQWLPMISDWWRVPENQVAKMYGQGWSCDNDVHEHFRFLTEQFIPNAFVIERADGSIRTWNCTVSSKGGKLIVTPAENVVSRVHFNLQKRHSIEITFEKEKYKTKLNMGMQWVGPGLNDYRAPDIYLWNEMMTEK